MTWNAPGSSGLFVPLGGPTQVGDVSPSENICRWATVVGIGPLSIRLDGDGQVYPAVPDSLVAALQVDDRVWVQMYGRRLVILGSASTAASRVAYGMLPGGYQQIVTNSTANAASTSPVDIAGLACTVTVAANRRIKVTVDGMLFSSVASDRGILYIREGSTIFNNQASYPLVTANSGFGMHFHAIIVGPSAGVHTYKASIARVTGTGSINVIGSATQPSSILVEDIGPV